MFQYFSYGLSDLTGSHITTTECAPLLPGANGGWPTQKQYEQWIYSALSKMTPKLILFYHYDLAYQDPHFYQRATDLATAIAHTTL